MPSMTSESTRFFGHPKETNPIFMGTPQCSRLTRRGAVRLSRIDPVKHSRIGNRLTDVLETADPAHAAFDAHAETAMGHRAVAAQIEIPLEGLLGQIVFLDAF